MSSVSEQEKSSRSVNLKIAIISPCLTITFIWLAEQCISLVCPFPISSRLRSSSPHGLFIFHDIELPLSIIANNPRKIARDGVAMHGGCRRQHTPQSCIGMLSFSAVETNLEARKRFGPFTAGPSAGALPQDSGISQSKTMYGN